MAYRFSGKITAVDTVSATPVFYIYIYCVWCVCVCVLLRFIALGFMETLTFWFLCFCFHFFFFARCLILTIVIMHQVRAYYIGDRLLVEVDIVLPPDCPLREAHDVGEALQDALELMDNVERAFVHLDYNPIHAIEHRRVVEGVGFGQ